MSYNGNGVFNINTAGQPVVAGTVISSTAFNALTADLAGGLSTAITKDGQTTPTANIPLGGFKLTNVGAGTLSNDAVRVSQLQAGNANLLSVSGADTIVASSNPALTTYTAGNAFNFVVATTNTSAVTINIDGLGAKAITKSGTTALSAGDLVAGTMIYIVYDGTRFQQVYSNVFDNINVSGSATVAGSLLVVGAATFNAIKETTTVSATAATGTINFDCLTQPILYYTTNASANWTLNFRSTSSATLNSLMSIGQTISVTFMATQGATAYYNSAVTIDGSAVTPKWQSIAPSFGNANSVDVYTYAILKTANATFTVFASQTKFV
jgi:hypothetical protein